MGEWDLDAVRRLFNSLEFRTLLDRLEDVGRPTKPAVEAASIDVRAGTRRRTSSAPSPAAGRRRSTLTRRTAPSRARRLARRRARRRTRPCPTMSGRRSGAWLARRRRAPEVGARRQAAARRRCCRRACDLRGVAFDTLLAGYLLDPAEAQLPAGRALRRRTWAWTSWRRSRRRARRRGRGRPAQLFDDGGVASRARPADRRLGRGGRAAGARHARADRARRRSGELLRGRGAAASGVLGEDAGVRHRAGRRVPPRHVGDASGDRMATLEADIYRHAGEEFNLNSPPQLARDPVREARAVAGQADVEGRALHRRRRAGEAPRPAPDRRGDPRLPRAVEAEVDVPGRAASAGEPARRPHPHHLQPGGRGHRAAVQP